MTTATGLVSLVLAPFGAFAINLAAITAAICMSPEAHADPAKRYTAPVVAGIFYTLLGLAGGAVVALLAALPQELVATVAGLALLGSIAGGLAQALAEPRHRDAAVITFLVTLSGISVAGIGAAFWGVVAGSLTLAVQNWRKCPPRSAFGAPPDPQESFQSRGTASGPAKPVPRRPLS